MMIKLKIIFTLWFVVFNTYASAADCWHKKPDVWYDQARLSFHKANIPGKNLLVLYGQINAGDAKRFKAEIKAYQKAKIRIDEIWLDSPGGSPEEAMKIGQTIRDHGYMTRIPQNYACMSACVYIFSGGAIRVVDPGGMFGTHMFSAFGELKRDVQVTKKDLQDLEKRNAQLAHKQSLFIQRMGLDASLLQEITVKTKHNDMYCLSPTEVVNYNVQNFNDASVGEVNEIH